MPRAPLNRVVRSRIECKPIWPRYSAWGQSQPHDLLGWSLFEVLLGSLSTLMLGEGIAGTLGGTILDGATQAKEIMHQFDISFSAPLHLVSTGLQASFAASFDIRLVPTVVGLAVVGKVGGAAWVHGYQEQPIETL